MTKTKTKKVFDSVKFINGELAYFGEHTSVEYITSTSVNSIFVYVVKIKSIDGHLLNSEELGYINTIGCRLDDTGSRHKFFDAAYMITETIEGWMNIYNVDDVEIKYLKISQHIEGVALKASYIYPTKELADRAASRILKGRIDCIPIKIEL